MTSHPLAPGGFGVRIAGTGSALPSRRLSNADLEKMMDTSDEWIVQRTGIRERRIIDPEKNESTYTLATAALRSALDAAKLTPRDLDLIVLATMTAEMECPPSACLVANAIHADGVAAFDFNAACSGYVFAMNTVHDLVACGRYRNAALIGADTLSKHMTYSTAGRGTAIIFGDGAGAAIFQQDPNPRLGILAQSMRTDAKCWKEIFIPHEVRDFPEGMTVNPEEFNHVHMNGAGVFKFAVTTFPHLIQETLDKARLTAQDVDLFVCHQSNARILVAARERFNLPAEKLYINIDRVGNTVGASVPICLDEVTRAGRLHPGMKVMFLAFGGGLTWGSSLWQT